MGVTTSTAYGSYYLKWGNANAQLWFVVWREL